MSQASTYFAGLFSHDFTFDTALFHRCSVIRDSLESCCCFPTRICDSFSPLLRASILVSHSALVAGQREMALVNAHDQPNQQRDEPVGQHFVAIDWFILLVLDFVPVSGLLQY